MSGANSRTVRRAQAGTTEAPWVRYTLITLALGLPTAIMLNILFFASMLGSIVEGLIQLRYYKKGI